MSAWSLIRMLHAPRIAQFLAVAVFTFTAGFASAEIQLTLKNSFIEKYKNLTTISDGSSGESVGSF